MPKVTTGAFWPDVDPWVLDFWPEQPPSPGDILDDVVAPYNFPDISPVAIVASGPPVVVNSPHGLLTADPLRPDIAVYVGAEAEHTSIAAYLGLFLT